MSEIVYVLTNPAMPGLVKIGKTTRESPNVRMNELYSTGVPVPFDCEIAVSLEDGSDIEKKIHEVFEPYRLNPKREFFQIESYQARAILDILVLLNGKDVTPQVNAENEEIDIPSREAGKRLRRPKLNFSEMGIPTDSKIISIRTDDHAIVKSDKKVLFQEEEMSLTRATKIVLDIEYDIQPSPYWTFEGRTLKEIYNETYLDI